MSTFGDLKLTRMVCLCVCCFLVAPLAAQTTRIYADGETEAAPFDTTGDPLSLSIVSGTATQSGLLFGSGSVTKIGLGSIILTNDNTYTGGTTISAGALQIGNGGGSGWIVGDVVNNGVLNFHRAGDNEFTGLISGTGSLRTEGQVLRFTQAQTYAGPTMIESGILVLAPTVDFGLASSTVVDVGSAGALDLSNRQQRIAGLTGVGAVYSFGGSSGDLEIETASGQTYDYAGVVGSVFPSFSLTKTGAGTQILSGNNNYTGGTTVQAGTLQIGNGAPDSGSIIGSVVNHGTVAFHRTGDYEFTGVISGTGGVTANVEILRFAQAQTYAGPTNVNGYLILPNTVDFALAATSVVTLTGSSRFDIGRRNQRIGGLTGGGVVESFGSGGSLALEVAAGQTHLYTGNVGGSHPNFSLTKDGPGTQVLAGDNTYSGGTTILGGTLQIGTGGLTGSIAGDVLNHGVLAFHRQGGLPHYGSMTGTGALVLNTSLFRLAGIFSHTGGTTVNGALEVGVPFFGGWISGPITNNGSVEFNRQGDHTFTGVISGGGSVVQNGEGLQSSILRFAQAQTYTGTTLVRRGILILPNTIDYALSSESLVTLNGGTMLDLAGRDQAIAGLTGTGTVRSFNSPGNSLALHVGTGLTHLFEGTLGGDHPNFSLEKFGAGTQVLAGENHHTGSAIIHEGTLSYGNGGSGGSLPMNIVNNATLIAHRAGNHTYAGRISGTGEVIFRTFDLRLTAAQTYTGPTFINLGTLTLSPTEDFGLADGSVITIAAGGATLDMSNRHQRFTGLSGGGRIISTGGSNGRLTLDISAGQTSTFVGDLGHNAPHFSVTKDGAGVLVLAGNNVFTGGTTINGGTLQLGNGGVYGMVPGNVTNHGTLLFRLGSPSWYEGVISGTGGVTQDGLLLRFVQAQTYTGETRVDSGILALPTSMDFGISASSVVRVGVSGQLDLSNRQKRIAGLAGNGLVFSGGANGRLTSDVAAGLSHMFFGVLGDSGRNNFSFIKEGAGTQILAGPNTYTGGTTILGGTLQIGVGGGAGSIPGNILNEAALVFNRSDNPNFHGTISGSGSVTQAGAGTLTMLGNQSYLGGTVIANGTLQLGASGTSGMIVGDVVNNGSLVFNRADDVEFSGAISGSGDLLKRGAGSLTLTGLNSYSGNTTVEMGTLRLPGRNAFYGGTVDATTAARLSVAGGTTMSFAVGGTGYFTASEIFDIIRPNATLASGARIRIDTTHAEGGVSTQINPVTDTNGGANKLALVKAGTGTLVLAGDNTYTGGTSIEGGTLQIGNGGDTGSLTGNVANSGALVFQRTGSVTFNGTISGTGSLIKNGPGRLTLSANQTYSGDTTITGGTLQIGNSGGTGSLSGNVINNGTLVFRRTNEYVFHGVISGSGNVVNEGDIVRFTQAQTYSGDTEIASGFLVLSATMDFGLASSSLVRLGGPGFLDLANRQQRIAGLEGSGTVYSFGGSDGILTLDVGAGKTHTFSGALGSDYAAFSLVKDGAGTQILTGTNTYTGSTTITAGTLVIEGSLATSPVTVGAGGSLGGNGMIGGPLHFASGASLRFDPTDSLTINGTSVTFDGFGIHNLVGLDASTPNGIYTVLGGLAAFDFANVLNFGSQNAFDLGGGKSAWFQEGSLQVVVVPEPSAGLLVFLSLAILFLRRAIATSLKLQGRCKA